jgi:hypothetical protein
MQVEEAVMDHEAKDKAVKGEDLETTSRRPIHRKQQSSGDEVYSAWDRKGSSADSHLTEPLRSTSYNRCRNHLEMEKMLQIP